jgi:uncharacterized protein YdhG (YjbR/CyaY superfamily)
MAKPATVDDYLRTLPPSTRAMVRDVRQALRAALPKAEEVISYSIPAFRLDGGVVLWFAGWKKHVSIYPATKGVRKKFAKQLAKHDINDKGTIRFPLDEKLPIPLIVSIAKLRAKEVS